MQLAKYYSSLTSMPSARIDTNGVIYLTYSAYTENIDNGLQVFDIYLITSSDSGLSWSCPIDLTPSDNYGQQECVFGHMNKIVDDKLMLLFQRDFEPGLSVRGDNDMISQMKLFIWNVMYQIFLYMVALTQCFKL